MKTLLYKTESRLFFGVLLFYLLPVIILTPFVTLDGPAHVYNARLLHDLITGPDQLTARFYEINPVPEPNWSGHIIMGFLIHFIPALWTEKLLQLLLLSGFAIGYRKLILTLEPSAVWITWMLFPLLYNFTFLMGFYNFMAGMALLPFFVSRFIQHYEQKQKASRIWLNGLLLTTIFFSHLLIFLIAGLICGIYILLAARKDLRNKKLLELLLQAAPGILLTISYFLFHGNAGYRDEIQWLPPVKILEDLMFSRGIIMYDYLTERRYTLFFSMLVLGILFTGLYHRTIQKHQKAVLFWLISSLAILFLVPDSMASGGIITPRLELWFILLLILYLGVLRIPGKIAITAGITAAVLGIVFGCTRLNTQILLNKEAKSILAIKDEIHAPSQLLPINQSTNWMHSNLTSYLGAIQQVMVLDNYEADHRIFPVKWKEGMNPTLHAGNHTSVKTPCITIAKSEEHSGFRIDYISIWMKDRVTTDSCSRAMDDQLKHLYEPDARISGNFSLYTRKQN